MHAPTSSLAHSARTPRPGSSRHQRCARRVPDHTLRCVQTDVSPIHRPLSPTHYTFPCVYVVLSMILTLSLCVCIGLISSDEPNPGSGLLTCLVSRVSIKLTITKRNKTARPSGCRGITTDLPSGSYHQTWRMSEATGNGGDGEGLSPAADARRDEGRGVMRGEGRGEGRGWCALLTMLLSEASLHLVDDGDVTKGVQRRGTNPGNSIAS
jgi:hypothetical protein